MVASELLARRETVTVIARDPARVRKWVQQGAEVTVGSLDDRAFVAGVVRHAAGFFTILSETR